MVPSSGRAAAAMCSATAHPYVAITDRLEYIRTYVCTYFKPQAHPHAHGDGVEYLVYLPIWPKTGRFRVCFG